MKIFDKNLLSKILGSKMSECHDPYAPSDASRPTYR